MSACRIRGGATLIALGVVLAAPAPAEPTQQARPAAKSRPAGHVPVPQVAPKIEPKAINILKAASDQLAAARTMRFTAVSTYESPSRVGPPLMYTTTSDVTLQRPDKLRVITPGDGPPSEFYYDGHTMMAYMPQENLVAIADAPPTIDAMLKAVYDVAATYFPFSDVIVADPYKDFADGLLLAFYIGQSHIVGGTTTDMVAIANDQVFAQIWIGADDKLPRMMRAVYAVDPQRLRQQVELSNWRLDGVVAADTFTSARAAAAPHIDFARPDPQPPPGAVPAKKSKASKSRSPKAQ